MKHKLTKLFGLLAAGMLAVCAVVVAACDFTFRSRELDHLELDVTNAKTEYLEGEEYSPEKLWILAFYDDGTSAEVGAGYYISAPDMRLTAAEREEGKDIVTREVEVIYGLVSESYEITVAAFKCIALDGMNRSFKAGEAFSTEGLVVNEVYGDGTLVPVTGYEVVQPDDLDMNTPGSYTITVRYEKWGNTYSESYDIAVLDPEAVNIRLDLGKDDAVVQQTFFVDDVFNYDNLAVYLVYRNGSEVLLEGGYNVSKPDMSKAGEKKVTVTYGAFTAQYTIKVEEPVIEKIEVVSGPAKHTYYEGEAFAPEGLRIEVSYNDPKKAHTFVDYTAGGPITVTAPDMNAVGEQKGSVSYAGHTAEFSVTIQENVLTGITVALKDADKTYDVGAEFTASELVVTANYAYSGKDHTVIDFTLTAPSTAQKGEQEGSVKFGTVEKTFTIKVYDVLTGIIVTNSVETYYAGGGFAGDEFTKSDLTVKAVFNGNTEAAQTVEFTLGANAPTGELEAGRTYTFTVSYSASGEYVREGSKTETVSFTVETITLTSFTVKTPPTTQAYYVGDSEFSAEGLVITANYNDTRKNGNEIADPAGATVTGSTAVAGENVEFTVNYAEQTATFSVTVYALLTGITLDTANVQKQFYVNDAFNYENLVVTAHYNGKEDVTLQSGYTVIAPDMASAGEQKEVIVTYFEELIAGRKIEKEGAYTVDVVVHLTAADVTYNPTYVRLEESGESIYLVISGECNTTDADLLKEAVTTPNETPVAGKIVGKYIHIDFQHCGAMNSAGGYGYVVFNDLKDHYDFAMGENGLEIRLNLSAVRSSLYVENQDRYWVMHFGKCGTNGTSANMELATDELISQSAVENNTRYYLYYNPADASGDGYDYWGAVGLKVSTVVTDPAQVNCTPENVELRIENSHIYYVLTGTANAASKEVLQSTLENEQYFFFDFQIYDSSVHIGKSEMNCVITALDEANFEVKICIDDPIFVQKANNAGKTLNFLMHVGSNSKNLTFTRKIYQNEVCGDYKYILSYDPNGGTSAENHWGAVGFTMTPAANEYTKVNFAVSGVDILVDTDGHVYILVNGSSDAINVDILQEALEKNLTFDFQSPFGGGTLSNALLKEKEYHKFTANSDGSFTVKLRIDANEFFNSRGWMMHFYRTSDAGSLSDSQKNLTLKASIADKTVKANGKAFTLHYNPSYSNTDTSNLWGAVGFYVQDEANLDVTFTATNVDIIGGSGEPVYLVISGTGSTSDEALLKAALENNLVFDFQGPGSTTYVRQGVLPTEITTSGNTFTVKIRIDVSQLQTRESWMMHFYRRADGAKDLKPSATIEDKTVNSNGKNYKLHYDPSNADASNLWGAVGIYVTNE